MQALSRCAYLTAGIPNPLPGQSNQLSGVYARSANDVWAVGEYSSSSTPLATLILHWNGTKWAQVPSPNPGAPGNELNAVSADSATDAWAVGTILASGGVTDTLILHWNGTSWSQVSSPTPANSYLNLAGVSAISASDAWAVGTYYNNTANTYDTLSAALAVGEEANASLIFDTLGLRWNGTK